MKNGLTAWLDGLDPGTRNLTFVAAILAVGYLWYGRDGAAQTFLPFPQSAGDPGWKPSR